MSTLTARNPQTFTPGRPVVGRDGAAQQGPSGGATPGAIRLSPTDLAALETLLTELLGTYEQLATATREHKAALSMADRAALDRCLARSQSLVGRLQELEEHRVVLARRCTGAQPGSAAALAAARAPLSTLLSGVAEPARGRLLALAARVREVAEAVREQQRVLHVASLALLAHSRGLMAQVGRSLNQSGTYARPATRAAEQVVSSLDLRS